MRALVECKADVEARDEVRSGWGRVLRFCVREGGKGGEVNSVGYAGGRERVQPRISGAQIVVVTMLRHAYKKFVLV